MIDPPARAASCLVAACVGLLGPDSVPAQVTEASEHSCWGIPEARTGIRDYCLSVDRKVVLVGSTVTVTASAQPPLDQATYRFTFDGAPPGPPAASREVARTFDKAGTYGVSVAFFDDGVFRAQTGRLLIYVDSMPAAPAIRTGEEPRRPSRPVPQGQADPVPAIPGPARRNGLPEAQAPVGRRPVPGAQAARREHPVPDVQAPAGRSAVPGVQGPADGGTGPPPARGDTVARARPAGEGSGILAQARRTVRLTADQARMEAAREVTFRAALEPPLEGVGYRYSFGTGTRPETMRSASVTHTYERPGRYRVVVEVLQAGTVVATSRPLLIEVGPGGGPAWLVALSLSLALLLLLTGGLAFLRLRRRRRAAGSELTIRPVTDPGVGSPGRDGPPAIELEVRLRPVPDSGTQELFVDHPPEHHNEDRHDNTRR